MPPAGRSLRPILCALLLGLAACSAAPGTSLVEIARGQAEQSGVISREDATNAVRTMVSTAPVCMAWPAVWTEGDPRREIVVRYDLMRRDWGESVAVARERRMDDFVAMGFLVKRAAPEIVAGAAIYTVTTEGRRYFLPAEDEGAAARFCAPAERRLVSVVAVTPGDFSCGSVRVRFMHVADAPPSWARTPTARARWEASGPPVGQVAHGVVSLGRRGGTLRSLCAPADLDLRAPPS